MPYHYKERREELSKTNLGVILLLQVLYIIGNFPIVFAFLVPMWWFPFVYVVFELALDQSAEVFAGPSVCISKNILNQMILEE